MSDQLLNAVQRALAAFSFLILTACASGPEVRVNVDSTADFSQYKTFAFFAPLGTDHDGYQSIVSQRLKVATQRELEARGMTFDTKAPQLLVNFNGALSEKLRVTQMPLLMHGYYGYRAGMYSVYPLYEDRAIISKYTEGTLNIDIIDAARKQLVWEGVVTSSVTQKDLDNVQPAIDVAVAAAFVKYPATGPAKPK